MGIEMSTVETGIDAGLVRAKRLENELETTENQEEVLAEIANELPTDEQVAPQFANLTELLKTRGINYDLTTAAGRQAFKEEYTTAVDAIRAKAKEDLLNHPKNMDGFGDHLDKAA
jgi:hypothetical protein